MPYDKPWRLGAGVAVIAFGTDLGFAASDDIQARLFNIDVEHLMLFYRYGAIVFPIVCGALAVAIGFELRARLGTERGRTQVRRAILRRNAEGGYDDEPQSAPASTR